MTNTPSRSSHSDRPPVYLSPAQRAEYKELAESYRSVAGTKTGPVAAAAYDNSATYYEKIRDHATANQMRKFAELLRKGGQQAATAYEMMAVDQSRFGKFTLAEKLRNFAHRVRARNNQSHEHIHTFNLDDSITASIIGIGLFMGVSLSYSGFTGNAISNGNNETTGLIGLLVLLIVIGFGAFYILRKKRKKIKR
jgi:hypothetical protein